MMRTTGLMAYWSYLCSCSKYAILHLEMTSLGDKA